VWSSGPNVSRGWGLVVFGAAVLTAVVVAVAPVVSTSTCSATSPGPAQCSSGSETLLANEGAGVLGILAVPALVALVPLLVPSRRAAKASAVVLTAAVFVASASVGVFFVPTLVLAWAAVVAGRRAGQLA
jgi:hypothetical protein